MLQKKLIIHPELGESMHMNIKSGIVKQLHLYKGTQSVDADIEVPDWDEVL